MATISFDGQSLIVEGRRVWLVSGSIDYCRIPRALWRDRIRAAAQAGLNCLQVSAFWHVHETQPGVFRFEDEFDLAAFIEMIGDEGMRCILRPGPFVGSAADMGGMPPWLLERGAMKLRQGDSAFLQAVARWFDALIHQVQSLQITHSPAGPIVLVQLEHEWLCHHPVQSERYLGELARFLREAGCETPLVSANNLWQSVPGAFDAWNGGGQLLANARQLRVLQPDAPRLIARLPVGQAACWQRPSSPPPAAELMRQVAQAAAAGAMFNLEPFVGGTQFSFRAGRSTEAQDAFHTASHDAAAPLAEGGARRDSYRLLRRLCAFLSHYHGVMAHLDPASHPTVVAPGSGSGVVQLSGSHGQVVFLFRDPNTDARQLELLTSSGRSLTLPWAEDESVAWTLLNARVDGIGRIDFATFRPWIVVGKRLLVFYGPADAPGQISIDGACHHLRAPTGDQPLVVRHEKIHLVVLNHRQLDAAYWHRHGLMVGCAGLDADDQPIHHPDFPTCHAVDDSGAVRAIRPQPIVVPAAPKVGKWEVASLESYAAGSSPRFATLPGPQSLEASGADFGYGWYKIRLKRSRPAKLRLMPATGGDRLHFYHQGRLETILGVGPGAQPVPLELSLPVGASEWVVLADNLGRFCEGAQLDQPKGLAGPLLDVVPVKLGKVSMDIEPRVDPFLVSGYVPGCSVDQKPLLPRHSFTIRLSTKMPVVVRLSGDRPRCAILVNGHVAALDLETALPRQIVLLQGLKKGANTVTLAQLDPSTDSAKHTPARGLSIFKASELPPGTCEWWYARWQLPGPTAFKPMTSPVAGAPAFFRTTFRVERADRPLWLVFQAATKGQLYLNGRNLGRYFFASPQAKPLPATQVRHYLPEPWLRVDQDNELILFDEHGVLPSVKLHFE
jgi:hypothetical protein